MRSPKPLAGAPSSTLPVSGGAGGPGGPWLVQGSLQTVSISAWLSGSEQPCSYKDITPIGCRPTPTLPVEAHLSSITSAKTISESGHTHRFHGH